MAQDKWPSSEFHCWQKFLDGIPDYLVRSEEKRVVEQFGEEYRAYRRRVPIFFPRMGQWRQLLERSKG